MDNKYTGEVQLRFGDQVLTLVYDWAALAQLKSSFTDEDLQEVVNGRNLDLIAKVLEVGLKKKHPDITAEKITEESPPFILCVQAIDKALTLAYFGPDNPKALPEKKSKKKTRKK